MEIGFYEAQWPKDNLYIDCFVHEVVNFRYHWHQDMYELNILLSGQQYFCCGTESILLKENDVVIINPNIGHASYCQSPGTYALVLHFSAKAFKQLIPKGSAISFLKFQSGDADRDEPCFNEIRNIASKLLLNLHDGGDFSQYTAKACTEMLISNLCNNFNPTISYDAAETDEDTQAVMRLVMSYIEEHYNEKISLEEIAKITQYNRTYISTLFHKAVGITFYEYLMRVRMQNAIKDLQLTNKKLTDIALDNGFSDLKSFNKRFRELLNCLPSEYRNQILANPSHIYFDGRKYISPDISFIRNKLESIQN